MTSLLRPFSGFIPSADFAPRIVGPPSAMLQPEQKNALRDDPLSFRHVVGRGARADHAEAMQWLQTCHDAEALVPVEDAVIVHRLSRGAFRATGFIADVSLAAYDAGRVKRHEATIAKTERKMVNYMETTRIFGNPVALTHRDHGPVAGLLADHTVREPDVAFEPIDGAYHELWVVTGDEAVTLCESFDDTLYITDGHHRLAAAATLAAQEGRADPYLPAALFAESELRLDAYSRVIDDDDVVVADVVASLSERFELVEVEAMVPRPTAPHELGVRLGGQSFVLTVSADLIPADTYDQLDVNLLQDLVLEPLFNVTNARTDSRLDFVADTSDDAHDVDRHTAWFLPYPTSVSDVMVVADSGRTMPPKSTFFQPKVPSGLVIRPVDNDERGADQRP